MHGDSRRLPVRRVVAGGGAAALVAGLAVGLAAGAALTPAAAQTAVDQGARCGGAANTSSSAKRAWEAAHTAGAPVVTAKLPAALRRGAAPTRIDLTVHNNGRRTYTRVHTGVTTFGSAMVSKDRSVFLTAKDVHVDQYVRGHGWRRVRLETGCDPSLGQTLWPAGGFTLQPGGTFHTTVRVAVTRHADARIKRADLDLGAYTSKWTGDRYRSVRLTG